MQQSIYTILTTHEGIYIFFLIPIIYFINIVYRVLSSNHSHHKHISAKDGLVLGAMGFITLDFINYLYLFSTGNGTLLPSSYLFLKYTGGWILWLCVFWYGYKNYLAPQAAGYRLRTRWKAFGWMCVGSLVLAVVGMFIS